MKQTLETKSLRKLCLSSVAAMLLVLAGCETAPQVPSSWPVLPPKPAGQMPPKPNTILESVQSDIQRWEIRRLERLKRLGSSTTNGPNTPTSKNDSTPSPSN